ncbi:conserved Plasmodium protein, unknown function [Plasmodium yoelii]|uniref:Uncharacterized protein n=3 Tax=Plasmodium yoelii TaxID=5861 RepID=A0AAF0AZB6_PLAYO|nr:conserved Plasmodium protein, unknown function [Plasmodium yoelii]EAA21634.1 hypothetical protein [Plasmodium yoelii yoelii]WBY56412.1 hypothetical protein Py17XNL_000704256 [Plasmodium yoelii yoelii]CDU17290.1 conserved Plasmodium protein, unknown function [Plasmodium yoelii]VTZ76518.1 conserved Plasmodium protein, unknown function [Plasmodium yoelii]|eukprot:XP_730069.1 conserved Plasmodium protein, unknown function [Plasmodium yoelii]
MKTTLFNGPYIPDIDAGYNVQVNGISVNFLKNPFCFRNNTIGNINYSIEELKHININSENTKSSKHINQQMYNCENSLTGTNYIELHKNGQVTYDGNHIYSEQIYKKEK